VKLLHAFRHRNFRLFFSGQCVSMIGTWVQQIAQSWLVYRLTGSPFMLGLTSFAGQIPILFLAPLGGVLSDRFDRRRMLLATQSVLMLQALALAALTLSGHIQVWHVLTLASIYGIAMGFDTPVRQSLIIGLVGDKQDLPNAIALNSMLMNASRMVGPSVAGLLLAFISEGWCFLINAASYLAILAGALALRLAPRPGSREGLQKDLGEALRYARSAAPIRTLLPLLALMSFMASPYVSLMPVIAREVLHGGAHTLGFLVGAAGLGALMGTSWLAWRGTASGLPKVIGISAAIAGGALMLVSRSSALWISLPLMLCVGFGIIVTAASINTILQTIVPDDKRGRVMSFYTMSFLGVAPIGALWAGTLASRIGAPDTLLVSGCCCVLGALGYRRFVGRLERSLAGLG
jgi:MFS family permease